MIGSTDNTMVFSKPLANGDRAVALYNSGDTPARVSTTAAQAGLAATGEYRLKDLWSKAQTETAGTIAATVPAHGTVMYRVHSLQNVQKLAPATELDVTSAAGYSGADVALASGTPTAVTTTLRNLGRDALTGVRITADIPDGWTLTPTSATTANVVKKNQTLTTTWQLTAPAGTATGLAPFTITASYTYDGVKKVITTVYQAQALVLPTPPSGTVALSDVTWLSATNGWGPVEKDQSNGETGAGDGQEISIRGTKYPKGLEDEPAQQQQQGDEGQGRARRRAHRGALQPL